MTNPSWRSRRSRLSLCRPDKLLDPVPPTHKPIIFITKLHLHATVMCWMMSEGPTALILHILQAPRRNHTKVWITRILLRIRNTKIIGKLLRDKVILVFLILQYLSRNKSQSSRNLLRQVRTRMKFRIKINMRGWIYGCINLKLRIWMRTR